MKPTNVGTELQLRPQRPERTKRPRIQDFDYKGEYAYHLTLSTRGHEPVFEDLELGRRCVSILTSVAAKKSFALLAFCFMPNHLHLLVQGQDESADLLLFVQNLKQETSFHFKQRTGRQLWQQSFFDRALRQDDASLDMAAYILQNPVAAGISPDVQSYPLSGGEFFDAALADGAEASSLRGPTND
ncbi:MAG TPA: transposase [Dehalococcoidia bacterium]|nr:transposase [Dehalococcoidia bacterium]